MGSGALSSFAVCVYCSSSEAAGADNLQLAEAVGTGLAQRGWTLVSGGGRVSMMGAVASAARAGGAHTVGVIPRALVEHEVADLDADELLVTETMRERKGLMDGRADAFLALPGGLGTLEELFETWTARILDFHRKPIVLLDPFGHYTGLVRWMREALVPNFARTEALDQLMVHTDVTAALDALAEGAPR
ncbi:MAG TPA: TIGR00730 family Rossman fold protein [Pseudonocardia sp.]|jgi:hypothetical protein|nr:TIGR00730 family Rossman fold protein [Pseudonocardia sp.]